MSSKRFLYLCVVLTILSSGMVTPLFRPAAAVAASPDTPSNVSPLDGATDVSLTPTLQSSAFSDHDWFDRHVASQWQIAAAGSHGTNPDGSYSSTVFDSDTDRSNLISIAVPSGKLSYSTTYYWHVRYRDSSRARAWSVWSPETSFATQRAALTFADPNLEAAIRGAIGKPTGTIYQSDLDILVTLNASSSGIKGLTGLEHCTSLKWLDLSNNQIGDISSLAGLTNLVYLELQGNQIGQISPLAGLIDLTWLELHDNQISDISSLASLTRLTTLRLHDNQISDISPLAGLTSLTELRLWSNQISDISSLASLTNLTELLLGLNQISDISPLAGLTKLTTLRLYYNQIDDISPLANLTNLTILALHNNQISDISSLANLTNLTELLLGVNQISDIEPLAGLTNLTILKLHDNQISDIEPLVDNPGIASGDTVYLNQNPLSDTSLYDYIPALEDRGVEVYCDQDGQPPSQPSNVSPLDGATHVSITPTLQSSVFSDPDGDTPAASWWQITTTAGDYSSPVFDSGRDTTHLTSIVAPALNCSTVYYWRVRYQDNRGVWSDWSAETSFTSSAQDAGDGESDGDGSSDGDGNGDRGTSPATSNHGGPPFWVWIIVGVGALLVVGVGVYLIVKRRPARQ